MKQALPDYTVPDAVRGTKKYVGVCKYCKKKAIELYGQTKMHKSCYRTYLNKHKSKGTIMLSNGLECRNDIIAKYIKYDRYLDYDL